MKKIIFLLAFVTGFSQFGFSQVSYTWNGSTSTNWGTNTNWTPNGIPGAIDNVTIVTGGNNCILNANTAITNITLTSGTLNLNGLTLSPTGNAIFTAGTVTNGTLTITGAAAATAVLTNTTFNASAVLNITTGVITVSGGTYGGAVTLNQIGATQSTGTGGATFNSTLSITNSGTNNFRINGNCTYNAATTFINSGTGYLLPELTTGSTYNGNLTLTNTSANQNIRMAYLGATNFNGNIIVNNTGGGNLTFCEQGTATATLANTKTISVGGSGFTVGTLTLSRFTQVGGTAQSISMTGSATMTINGSCTFNGSLTVSAPNIYPSASTFNGAVVFTKTDGTSSNPTVGGNTYNSTFTANYTSASGNGYWSFGFGAADIYNGDVFSNNNSLDRIIFGHNSANNQFNGNFTATQIGSSVGTSLTWNAASTCVMAAGKTISIGGAGFNTGYFYLQGLTQNGNAAINLTTTGSSAVYVGEGVSFTPSTIGGSFTVSAPDIYIRGGTFNGTFTVTKTGGSSNHNNQRQNIFNSTCTINQQSNGGYFMLGYNSNDQFNDNITVTSTGTGGIYFGWTGPVGTPVLAAGKTISVGGAGFSAGFLTLNGFTQLGNAAINLTFTGATTALTFAHGSVIGGSVTSSSADVLFNGCTFNGSVNATKTGAGTDNSIGGNIFNSTVTLTNSGSGQLMLGNGSSDQFNDVTTFNNTGGYRIYFANNHAGQTTTFASDVILNSAKTIAGDSWSFLIAENANTNVSFGRNVTLNSSGNIQSNCRILQGASTAATFTGDVTLNVTNTNAATQIQMGVNGISTYNGNISVTNNGGATGIYFNSNASASSTLANTKTITIGGGGFNSGTLSLIRFTQTGNTAQNLALTGSGTLIVGPTSAFGGNVIFSSPSLFLNGCTYSGTSSFTKNGATNDASTGGNTFTGISSVTNSGSGIMYLANVAGTPDNFVTDLTALNSGSGALHLAYTAVGNTFGGNVIFNNTANGAANTISIVSNTNATASITGNLTMSNTGTGTANTITLANGTTTNLSIGGNLSITHASNGTGNNYVYVGNNGSCSITGSATINNTSGGTNSGVFVAHSAALSSVTIGNGLTITNVGTAATSNDVYISNTGVTTVSGISSIINNSTGSGHSRIFLNESAASSSLTFNGDVTLSNISTATGDIYFRNTRGAIAFNGNLIVNGTATTASGNNGIYLCWSVANTGTASLANTKTITVGGSGFSTGILQLLSFTQIGNTAQSLTLTGNATLIVGGQSSFGGNVTFVAPGVFLNGCSYAGTTSFTKNGATTDNSTGGNTFTGISTIVNSGAGIMRLANNTAPDAFVTDVTATNSGSGSLELAYGIAGNTFGGNVLFNNTANGAANTISIAANTNATAAITGNVTINNTGAGTNNTVSLANGTGTSVSIGGNLSVTHAATGTGNNYVYVGNNGSCSITGSATINNTSSGNNSAVYIAQGLAASNVTIGNGLTLTNAGSASTSNDVYLSNVGTMTITGASNIINNATGAGHSRVFLDEGAAATSLTFNNDVTFSNISTALGDVYFRNTRGVLTLNGNIIVNGTATTASANNGIYLCWSTANTGTASLANTKTITIGGSGFSTGKLQLLNFTQIGGTAQSLTLTGTGNLTVGASSAFGGNVTFVAPTMFLNGCTYSGTSSFTKNGATTDNSIGGNTFTGVSTIVNSGSGIMRLANNTAPDAFVTHVTATNSGSGSLELAYGIAGNTFGGNVTFNNSANGVTNAISIAYNNNATATITGNLTINNTAAGTNNTIYLANGTSTSLSIGGNLSITHAGSSSTSNDIYIAASGSVTITGTTSIINNSTGGGHSRVFLCESAAASSMTYGGDATFSNISAAAGDIYFRNTRGVATFNGNIIVNNIATTASGNNGIYLCWSTANTGTASLANTKTITVGGSGFSTGKLQLLSFTQIGGTAQSLTLTGTAALQFGGSSTFNGNVTSSSPTLLFNGCTFNGTLNSTKTGVTNDAGTGNNIFNGATTATNSGSGYLMFGNGNSDQFNAASTFNNTGSSNIYIAYNSPNNIFGGITTFNNTPTANSPIYVGWLSTGTTFNNNIIVTSTNGGVQFSGGNATATTILSAGNTITVGVGGFSAGTLLLRQFTQTGATAQNLTLTGTGNLTFGPTSAFGGNVTATTPTLFFNGCTFSGTTNCTKNGATNDASSGNNIFTGVSTMNNSGSGYLLFANTTRDQWLTDVTYNNTGSNIIYAAYNSVNNSFGGNVILNNSASTGNGSGIRVCEAASASATISGNLTVNNDPTSGTNNGIRVCEGNNATLSVTGTTNVTNTNTNTSNYIRFAQGTGSSVTLGGAVTATNNGTVASTNVIHFGYTGTTVFNDNITLNSNGGSGITFGSNGGTSTQANNKTINTGAFTGGPLYIRNFTQNGPTTGNSSNVSITGANMLLTFNGSSFYDNVTGSSQEITATNNTFRGTAALTKTTGNANDYFPGGNTFNGATTITNQSTFILGMANGTADAYNSDVTFVQSNTGALRPNYNANCTYAGNITVTAPAATAITFGVAAAGIATMSGANAQTINITTGNSPVFTQFVMNKTANNVTLNTPINISTLLGLTGGLINTTAANLVIMQNASTAPALTSASTSFINGPMRYQKSVAGSTALNLPIGKGADCRPAVLTVNHSNGTLYNYTAELFNADPWAAFGSGVNDMPTTVDTISGVHYWTITRTDGAGVSQPSANLSGNQLIQLYFDVNDGVYQGASLTIVKNTTATPATWIDIGGSSALGNFATPQAGSVSSTSAPSTFTSFSSFTLASKTTGWDPLPVELLSFTAKPAGSVVALNWSTATETNNDHFEVERSSDASIYEYVTTTKAYGSGNSISIQNYKATDIKPYSGTSYYRLKQVDKNGAYKYSGIAQVNFTKKSFVAVYPNPVLNKLTIDVSDNYLNANAKIIDALGNIVYVSTIDSYSNQIDLSFLQSGIYYLVINDGADNNRIKIILQK